MSLVEKIPPLISALAFGYGLVMATPDDALERVQGAVDGYRSAAVVTKKAATAPVLSPAVEQKLAGGESPLLAELRATRAPGRYSDQRQFSSGSQRFDRGLDRYDDGPSSTSASSRRRTAAATSSRPGSSAAGATRSSSRTSFAAATSPRI